MKGLGWRLGGGNNIRLWNEAWVPSLEDGLLKNGPLNGACADFKVNDIIVDGRWDLSEIRQWLTDEEANAVLCTQFSRRGGRDRRIWFHF